MPKHDEIFGIVGSFPDQDILASAARSAREEGYTSLTTYSPYESETALHALGWRDKKVQVGAFLAGLLGIGVGYFLQYYTTVISYPINIGGRPLNSVPAFMQVTFEMMVLCAALFSFFAVFFMSGLPRLHQPVFNSRLVSGDRFCLLINAADPVFDREKVLCFLKSAGAREFEEITA